MQSFAALSTRSGSLNSVLDRRGRGSSSRSHQPSLAQASWGRDSALESEARAAAFDARSLSSSLVHDDEQAARLADSVSARAFTVGDEVFIDRRHAGVGTEAGRRLLAHELAHVDQQRDVGRWIQRDDLPDLGLIVRLNSMTDVQLHQRYDDIVMILLKAKQSTPENFRLQKEAGEIGAILARRAGRTFGADDIGRMRKFFEDNAKSGSPKSCIGTLNEGMRTVLKEPKQKLAGEVDKTAGLLQASGHAGPVTKVDFYDAKGKPTKGTLSPVKLRESVWDTVVSMAGGDRGWSVFVMSLMDGYHSVTLSLDNTDPGHPRIYWSDQWSTKGGFKEYNKAGLDAEIEHLTHNWWEEEAAGTGESAKKTHKAVRMTTTVRLYRILGTPRPVTSSPSSQP